MTFKLSIKCDNSAFTDDSADGIDRAMPGPEIARILRKVAVWTDTDLDTEDGEAWCLLDINGNRVGTAELLID